MTDRKRALGAAWAPEHATRRRVQQPLSRQQIVRGAMRFLQENSLDELSMRRLAANLGTAATSLYWHVATKEQLLDLVLDEMFGEVRIPEPGEDWAEDIAVVMADLRRVLREYRTAAHLVVSRPTVGPHTLGVFEFVLTSLRRAGFDDRAIPFAYDLLTNYTIGSVLVETSWFSSHAPDESEEQEEELTDFMKSLPEERFPTLVSFADTLFTADEDAKFAFGLKRVLSGLAADLAEGR